MAGWRRDCPTAYPGLVMTWRQPALDGQPRRKPTQAGLRPWACGGVAPGCRSGASGQKSGVSVGVVAAVAPRLVRRSGKSRIPDASSACVGVILASIERTASGVRPRRRAMALRLQPIARRARRRDTSDGFQRGRRMIGMRFFRLGRVGWWGRWVWWGAPLTPCENGSDSFTLYGWRPPPN